LKNKELLTHCDWLPIETYVPAWDNVLLSHAGDKWIRFGFKYPGINRWYYSGCTTTSMRGSDEEPTHWAPPINPPWK
jgi:hypothetical protein